MVLGALLLLAPVGVLDLLGLPPADSYFYVAILGAVLVGIGVALLVEVYGKQPRLRGLGLGGAIAINLCGGLALLLRLIVAPPELPLRGTLILWGVAIAVLGIAAAELGTRPWRDGG